jgi:hypothetical protein
MAEVLRSSREYWTVTPMTCRCGTVLSRRSAGIQRLYERQSVHAESLRVSCETCGREVDVDFDIASSFGNPLVAPVEGLLDDRRPLREMYLSQELDLLTVLKYFSDLAVTGDIDALDLLADAAGQFLEESRETSRKAAN